MMNIDIITNWKQRQNKRKSWPRNWFKGIIREKVLRDLDPPNFFNTLQANF